VTGPSDTSSAPSAPQIGPYGSRLAYLAARLDPDSSMVTLSSKLRPLPHETQRMVERLVKVYGFKRTCACLGVANETLSHWLNGSRVPSYGCIKAIWLVWVLMLHRGRLKTELDLITWCRYSTHCLSERHRKQRKLRRTKRFVHMVGSSKTYRWHSLPGFLAPPYRHLRVLKTFGRPLAV
jgi:hypothetical protein